ncbi:alpha/beta hydrolase [Streptomyces sp. NPDC059853]|uniref:alpha/beta hydrolase n=1 Tax=Streptomyces sp. NPDC059853 TaxID=3346973 RepID=UPI0036580EF6
MHLISLWKRAVAAGAGAAACATLLTAPAWATDRQPADDDALAAYHRQHVEWADCGAGTADAEPATPYRIGPAAVSDATTLSAAGAECALLTVPLDYADPGGETLTLALSRIRAADPGRRTGVLLSNPGGPGGSGLVMPLILQQTMGEVAGDFDLIGFDPRFVGASSPIDCGWPVGSGYRAAGAGFGDYLRGAAFQRDLAQRCRATSGDVLPYATTRNTARDMDVIRAVLGEERISYLGYSYGSYLGEVYTQLFPGRTDRIVLDGVIHPDHYTPTLLRGTERAGEEALRAWADWAAERHADYGLGTDRAAVLATVDRVITAAQREPLHIGPYRLDQYTAPLLVFSALVSDGEPQRDWLATTTGLLLRAAAGESVEPDPGLALELEHLTTEAGSAYGSGQMAVVCGDVAERRGLTAHWRDLRRDAARHPLVAPITRNVTPCEFWDLPAEPPTVLDNDIPALLVAATGDTRTPYEGTVKMRAEWPSSTLITLDAMHHGVYGFYGNACVDDLVNDYLRTGVLPRQDVNCTE